MRHSMPFLVCLLFACSVPVLSALETGPSLAIPPDLQRQGSVKPSALSQSLILTVPGVKGQDAPEAALSQETKATGKRAQKLIEQCTVDGKLDYKKLASLVGKNVALAAEVGTQLTTAKKNRMGGFNVNATKSYAFFSALIKALGEDAAKTGAAITKYFDSQMAGIPEGSTRHAKMWGAGCALALALALAR